jgi:hypothetical protein
VSEFDPIDRWFEKGFRVRAQKASTIRRDAKRARAGAPPASGGVNFSRSAKAKNAASVASRAPEVMVKITGHSAGLRDAKRHLEYISRNGTLDLADEQREPISGLQEIRDLRARLHAAQVPQESSKREFLHVLFSMPPGTPAGALKEAVQQFCEEEFANRRYVMALHDDKDHTHLHVLVHTRDMERADEPRLSPKKADLFRWRLGFADKLREQGIEAAASERRHRGNYRRAEKAAVRQIRGDNPKSAVYDRERAQKRLQERIVKASLRPDKAFVGPPRPPRVPRVLEGVKDELQAALKAAKRPSHPHEADIERSKETALQGWGAVARNLVEGGDVPAAKQVAALMREIAQPSRSRMQELYDLAAERRGRGAELEQESGL